MMQGGWFIYVHRLQKFVRKKVQSPPPPNIRTDEKARYSEIGGIGSHILPTKPLFGTWKWAAVLGGAVLGGTTVLHSSQTFQTNF